MLLPSLLLSIRSLMAEPNPDDGLVPEILELYKRSPAKWTREAKRRTKLEATVKKLEAVEAVLDREGSKDACNCNEAKSAPSSASNDDQSELKGMSNKKGGNESKTENNVRSLQETENVENGKAAKRSKLGSRRR